MTMPWSISGDDLDLWAQRIGAPETLHELVRRLLLATAPLSRLEIRATGGVRLSGADALVMAREGSAFWPAGISLWELSTRSDVKKKLEEDFAKAPPEGVPPRQAAYVAVTAHRFPDKESWARAKLAAGPWAEVRVLDADNLSQWLDLAPAVRCWFAATQLQRPIPELTPIDMFLRSWSHRTVPPLPASIALAGRARREAAGELVRALQAIGALLRSPGRAASPPRPIRVAADTSEEALVFIAAALAEAPDSSDLWRARSLIVESEAAWRWCLHAQSAEPLVLLPRFQGVDSGQAAGASVAVIVPTSAGEPIPVGQGLKLDVIPFKPLAGALEEAGFGDQDPERLARESGGRLGKLQRACGYHELPDWAKGSPAADLLALLLAGAWEPTREPDREVLRRLGADPDEADRLCARLALGPDAAFEAVEAGHRYRPKHWRWVAPREAWRSLARNLTDIHLHRFHDVALEILVPPPVADSSPAVPPGVVPRRNDACSEVLRRGLASSIAWFAVMDAALHPTHRPGRGVELAEGLVSHLLGPLASAWVSLADILIDLAEAAPRAFFDRLEESLDLGEQGAGSLFGGGADPLRGLRRMGFGGSNEILWSLETLAWNRDLLGRVVSSLARLDRYDKLPANFANRPINTLVEILHPKIPQSQSTARDRIDLLGLLFRSHAEVAWKLTVDLVRSLRGGGLIVESQPPRYRGRDATRQEVTGSQINEQLEAMLALLLEHAGRDSGRWAELIALPLWHHRPRVLEALNKITPHLSDPETALWTALRHQLAWLNNEDELDEEKSAARDWIDVLYREVYRPVDPVLEHAWLFGVFERLPERIEGGWQVQEAHRAARQKAAVEALWQHGRLETIGRLAQQVKVPHMLGELLATAPFSDEIEEAVLANQVGAALGQVLPLFLGYQWRRKGWDWLEGALRLLLEQGRLEDATSTAVLLERGARTWDLIEHIGEPLCSAYWRSLKDLISDRLTPVELERGISKLLEVGRPDPAFEAASFGTVKVSSHTVLRILDQLRHAPREEGADRVMDGYHLERLFGVLDADPQVDSGKIIELEIHYFETLCDTKRSALRFYQKLASSPEAFIDLLRSLRRPETDSGESGHGSSRQTLGSMLVHWPGYPGQGLPTEEREQILERWSREVLDLAAAQGMLSIATCQLGWILARVEAPDDGHWPCLTARRLVEGGAHPQLRGDLAMAKRNSRGWVRRSLGEGGAQERALAAGFQAGADALRLEYPIVAGMLDELAAEYRSEAEQLDPAARRELIEYGEDEPSSRRRRAAAAGGVDVPRGPLRRLDLQGVGPAEAMTLDFSPRLNVLAGDNSAGKTFVLDVLWWALSGDWPTRPAWPRETGERRSPPSIIVHAGDAPARSDFDMLNARWQPLPERLASGLALYARVDGGFSVWDPLRSTGALAAGYRFTEQTLWEGLRIGGLVACNGLLEDLHDWITRKNDEHAILQEILVALSPPGETMQLGESTKLSLQDDRWYPTLRLSYGSVPVIHASAAVQRVLGLAYLLVWAWQGHRRAVSQTGRPSSRAFTLLWDEVEDHLHPKWQRHVMPALLRAVERLTAQIPVQAFLSTHAPLVLASLEPHFDPAQDRLLHLAIAGATVRVEDIPWTTHGHATNWLESNVFGLTRARSPEAERAIDAALAFRRGEPRPDLDTEEKIDAALRRTLPGDDPFFLHWVIERGHL